MDIPAAFLNGEFESNIYIYPPKGLKESPKLWNNRLNKFMTQHTFKHSNFDCCLHYNNSIWMIVYVDDILGN